MPAIVKAQTTKQAKAAYKARGRPALSEKEQRQLERAVELEARAERAKEADRRRAEAAKRRADQDKHDKAEAERLRLGTQRRYDRFGFKASQFHLGAFFGKPRDQPRQQQQPEALTEEDMGDEGQDMFEDGLDDDVLLQALDPPVPHPAEQKPSSAVQKTDTAIVLSQGVPMVLPNLQRATSAPNPVSQDDLNSFWDELDSSTQIARDLYDEVPSAPAEDIPRRASFSSGDFDLTAEDLDELDPPKQQSTSHCKIDASMQTPASPFRRRIHVTPPKDRAQPNAKSFPVHARTAPISTTSTTSKREALRLMLPPPLPLKRFVSERLTAGKTDQKHALGHLQAQNFATSRVQVRQPNVQAMPPPSPPAKSHLGMQVHMPERPQAEGRTQPSPGPMVAATSRARLPPVQAMSATTPPARSMQSKPPNAIRGPFLPASSLYCSPDLGFTLSQLENYVEDDIQLTQAAPG